VQLTSQPASARTTELRARIPATSLDELPLPFILSEPLHCLKLVPKFLTKIGVSPRFSICKNNETNTETH
jgi:hypothetical protein